MRICMAEAQQPKQCGRVRALKSAEFLHTCALCYILFSSLFWQKQRQRYFMSVYYIITHGRVNYFFMRIISNNIFIEFCRTHFPRGFVRFLRWHAVKICIIDINIIQTTNNQIYIYYNNIHTVHSHIQNTNADCWGWLRALCVGAIPAKNVLYVPLLLD